VEYAKEQGFEINSPDDLPKVFEAVKEKEGKLKQTTEELIGEKQKREALENIYATMPDELVNIFIAHVEGRDPKEEIQKIKTSPFDFSKDAKEYDVLKLVNNYSKKKYEQAEWDELLEDWRAEKLDNAIEKYNIEKTVRLNARKEFEERNIAQQKKLLASVDNSLAKLKVKFPQMGDEELTVIKKNMLGGFNEKVLNKDGTYKEEAAELFANAEYAPGTIGALTEQLTKQMEAAVSKAKSETREQIVLTGSEKPVVTGSEKIEQHIAKEVSEKTGFLKHL
jgi:hypothetical protein